MTQDAHRRPPPPPPPSLSTDEALELVRGLLAASPPSQPTGFAFPRARHWFSILTRPSPVEPVVVDCRGLRLHVDLNRGNAPPDYAARIHELLDVLAWLAVCPGCGVAGNAPLWQRIVAMLVETEKQAIAPTCLSFGDPETFPRWIVPFTASFGDVRPRYRKDTDHEPERRFIEELFAHSAADGEQQQQQPSLAYVQALNRLRPLVEGRLGDHGPPKIRLGIHLRCGYSSARVRYYEEIRAYVRALRATPSRRMRLDSLGLTMSKQADTVGAMDELSDLHELLHENGNLDLSRIETYASLLGSVAAVPDGDRVPDVLAVRRDLGRVLDGLIRGGATPGGRLDCIQVADNSTWQATVICTALRTSAKPIDHFVDVSDSGISCTSLNWLAYGLFHWSSRARVRLVELTLTFNEGALLQISELLATNRPGKVLLGCSSVPWDRRDEVTFCLIGTRARLRASTFQLWDDCFREYQQPFVADVTYTEADVPPEFEALATWSEWVGILVPGHGFGWVKREVVDCIWTEEQVPLKETHSVQEMIIHGPYFDQVSAVLQAVGGPLRSLRVRGANLRGTMTEEILDRILRACPNLTALDIPTLRLDPLVQAYEDGRCAVASLVVQNAYGEEPEVLARFLAMLRDRGHSAAVKLEKLAFRFQSLYSLTATTGRDIVLQMMVHSARLRVFYLMVDDRLDLGCQGISSDWHKTHPLIALKSIGGTLRKGAIRRLDPDLWGAIFEFTGPNRTIRVMSSTKVSSCIS